MGAGLQKAGTIGRGNAEAEEAGFEQPFLRPKREVGEPLSERQRKEGEKDAVHDDVPAVGPAGVDRFEVTLERAASERAKATELGAAEMPARVGERGTAEDSLQPAVEAQELPNLAALRMQKGVANGGKLHRGEQPFAVPNEERFECARGFRSWCLNEVRESGKGRERFGGSERLGERMDVAGETFPGGGAYDSGRNGGRTGRIHEVMTGKVVGESNTTPRQLLQFFDESAAQ